MALARRTASQSLLDGEARRRGEGREDPNAGHAAAARPVLEPRGEDSGGPQVRLRPAQRDLGLEPHEEVCEETRLGERAVRVAERFQRILDGAHVGALRRRGGAAPSRE
ncbi:MAG: hypothetical protein IPF66_03565 [Holophagales bacterium]|nr:hypothetical protein [Holophagales bacterium]